MLRRFSIIARLATISGPAIELECNVLDTLKPLILLDAMTMAVQVACILQDRSSRQSLLAFRGDEAQVLVDLLHALLDDCYSDIELNHLLLRALVKLSRDAGLYPKCLVLRGLHINSKDPHDSGRFGDVWKEQINGHTVAVKVIRTYVRSDMNEVAKAFSREAVTWAHLSHPHVLPFYGIFHVNESRSRIGFVSPWMENGTIVEFLRKNPCHDRLILVRIRYHPCCVYS